ncbi:hypothetical protein Tco_0733774, partial [Tanacetum coccineum]
KTILDLTFKIFDDEEFLIIRVAKFDMNLSFLIDTILVALKLNVAITTGSLFYNINTIPVNKQIQRISLTGFPAQSIRSSNADALDSPYLLVLIIETSQSRDTD